MEPHYSYHLFTSSFISLPSIIVRFPKISYYCICIATFPSRPLSHSLCLIFISTVHGCVRLPITETGWGTCCARQNIKRRGFTQKPRQLDIATKKRKERKENQNGPARAQLDGGGRLIIAATLL